jgi:hypothetical protein
LEKNDIMTPLMVSIMAIFGAEVEFREVAKLFITSFDRRSWKKAPSKKATTTKEKSPSPKETLKK